MILLFINKTISNKSKNSNNYIQFIVGNNVTNHLTADDIYDGGASGSETAMTIAANNNIGINNNFSYFHSYQGIGIASIPGNYFSIGSSQT